VTRQNFRIGLMAMTITVLSWAGMFPVGKAMLATLDPYAITSVRYGCGAAILLAILWLVEGNAPFVALRSDPRRWALFFYGSMGFAGFSLFNFEGLRLTSPQQASIIAGMQPLMIALTQWVLRGVRPARPTLICVALAFCGCVVVVSKGDFGSLALSTPNPMAGTSTPDPTAGTSGSVGGDLLVLVAAICWVVYTLAAARFSDWSPLRYTALSCGLGTFSILVFSALAVLVGHAHVPSLQQLESQALPMTFLVVMTSVVAVLLWNVGVKHLGALNASLIGNFIPVVVFLIGIAMGQDIAAAEFIGAGMVLAALFANNLYARRMLQALSRPRQD
jgi:drug/metabolite transporter (DMT)-like permease